ncbi:nuclear transport factor 2 family protein [Nocardiopsis synnemataformans]|uniref:nuclear transport factor 2 family protein n=1 Tax=Nocardiopsis synnemataformans TaxID=61305 RepID=UPI003EB6F0DD
MTAASDRTTAQDATRDGTRTLLSALEAGDLAALTALVHPEAVLVQPFSFSGAQEPEARLEGAEEVLGYLRQVTENFAHVRFREVDVSVTDDGTTAFVQADGDFTTADGRPYRNVYVLRVDWREGLVAHIDEYANPVTFCTTFGLPVG